MVIHQNLPSGLRGVVKTLISLKNIEILWECVFLRWGMCDFRLSTAVDYDLPRALAEVWFFQLQIVSVIM